MRILLSMIFSYAEIFYPLSQVIHTILLTTIIYSNPFLPSSYFRQSPTWNRFTSIQLDQLSTISSYYTPSSSPSITIEVHLLLVGSPTVGCVPIDLECTCTKLYVLIEQHMEDTQFEFTKGRSSEDAIHRLLWEIFKASRSKYSLAILLDIKNAFNTVWWSCIL